MEKEKEPRLWVTVVKLVFWTAVFIFLVGLGLYFSAEYSTYAPPSPDFSGPQWGISKDSPIRSNR